MTIATLYDIHGNLAALDAVLPEIPEDATIVVVSGHPHMQFDRTIAGRPFEEEPGAYWTLDLVHRFTPYESAPKPERSRAETLALFTERGL